MPELLTEQDIADLEILIRGQFGPQFSEPLIKKIKALNEFASIMRDDDTDETDAIQPTWATRMAGWGDDDA
jgi:hypothetical protein